MIKLEEKYFKCAVEHIIAYGDTDIFPYPFELKFLEDCKDQVVEKLADMDLAEYHPMSLIESLVPKQKFGFRAAHQPFLIDSVIYTALVWSIFDKVEAGRDSIKKGRAFSYRKIKGLDPSLFRKNCTYGDWLERIKMYEPRDGYSHVIRTDISDYYPRIYRHRLENILKSLSGEPKIVNKIEHFISDWRNRQSFGIPVGGNASRLLAEVAIHDVDMGLILEKYDYTRYVDDIVIFVKKRQNPYAALGFLAKQLSNEGLSLNIQKTRITTWDKFSEIISGLGKAENDADEENCVTEKLFWVAYSQDAMSQDALNQLKGKDLEQELDKLLSESFLNMAQIKIVLRAMRLTKNTNVARYIRDNLENLIPFAKETCLLIREFVDEDIKGFENIGGKVKKLLLSPRMRPLDCSRAWFLDLAVNKHITFSARQIRELQEGLTGILDIRQMHLIHWRTKNHNFFRQRRSQLDEIQLWAQPSFIFGASCLSKDEYEHWLRSIKSRLKFPLAQEFVDWCKTAQNTKPLG